MAKTLQIVGSTKAYVVSSSDGMDEISISDTTQYALLDNKEISTGVIDPREHGFKLYPQSEILGGDAQTNAKITKGILSGEISGAKRDIVLLNASYALLADDMARDIKEALEMSREAIESGKATEHLTKIVEVSQKI